MIGHELRNPLGAAINGLYLIRHHLAGRESPEVLKSLDLVERETNRAASLAEDLTAYMRERQPVLQRVELGAAVDQLLEAVPPPNGIDVSVQTPTVVVDADTAQLTQMLTNCVTNAYQAMPDGGSLNISAAQVNGSVEIVVEDTGSGVDPKADGRAFDPFFTTKAQGTGLGLAIVQRMAEAHGGTVSLENRSGGGARVLIRLPGAAEEVL
jgi:signal transduction histidine kinase